MRGVTVVSHVDPITGGEMYGDGGRRGIVRGVSADGMGWEVKWDDDLTISVFSRKTRSTGAFPYNP